MERYYNQLDGLRAFAVLFVIAHHYFGKDFYILSVFPWGFIGVNLFFVVSGFLITNILIKSSLKTPNKLKTIKNFIIRRSFRIFPLYYLTLFFFYFFNFHDVRNNILSYVFYFVNFEFYHSNQMQGNLSPRWSLCVEEQFYLFWPWIILFIKKNKLLSLFISLIFLSLIFRTVLVLISPEKELVQFLLFSNIDSLAFGAILSYLGNYKNVDWFTKNKRMIDVSLIVGILLLFVYSVFFHSNQIYTGILSVNLKAISVTLISFGLVSYATYNKFSTIIKKIIENKFVVYIGKISYGLYLYHSMIFLIFQKLNISIESYWLYKTVGLVALFIISAISYEYIEKPINNLKRYFSYD